MIDAWLSQELTLSDRAEVNNQELVILTNFGIVQHTSLVVINLFCVEKKTNSRTAFFLVFSVSLKSGVF